MPANFRLRLASGIIAGLLVLVSAVTSSAQQRYQPSTPTVSPYLNLFQNNRNGRFSRALPNYYSLVRPQLQQNEFNQAQLQIQQQQARSIQELQAGVGYLVQQQQTGQPVLTGHSSWFGVPATRARFGDTSTYFSRAGSQLPPKR
jgi:hypothetical protein